MSKSKKKSKRLSFRHVWETYHRPSLIDLKCTDKHIAEVEMHLKRWELFWDSIKPSKKDLLKRPFVKNCERKHLEVYRRHLMEDDISDRTINKYLGSIRTILTCAEKHGLLKRRAKLEQLTISTPGPEQKIYLRDEQIDALMAVSEELIWPKESSSGLRPSVWWRCAMVLFRTYGFRPQELLAYDSIRKRQPITWANISFARESPNPSSNESNEYGWLFYVPPKTKKIRPNPLYLPLTRHARAAISLIAAGKESDNSPLFRMPSSQTGYLKEWYRWFELAGVKPKLKDAKFTPMCLRRTCATHLSAHRTGLATAVCGWSHSVESKIASGHYISDEQLLRELLTAPMPKSFDEILSE